MSERDVMSLLGEANPVRAETLARVEFPSSILVERRSRRRPALVIAVASVVALAATLIGVFVLDGSGSRPHVRFTGPGAPGSDDSWKTIPLSEASSALGARVVLPDTDLVQPADADPKARSVDCSPRSCAVYVSFPAQSLSISYTHPSPYADPRAQWEADVRSAGSHRFQARLVDLNGTPGEYVDYPGVKRLVEFVAGETWIIVSGKYDEPTLQAVAQSIVDQSSPSSLNPPSRAEPLRSPTPVADAAAADALLPFKVVLPMNASPTSMGVYERSHSLDAYFDTEASGPYTLVEEPTTETVDMLKETAKMWRVGPSTRSTWSTASTSSSRAIRTGRLPPVGSE